MADETPPVDPASAPPESPEGQASPPPADPDAGELGKALLEAGATPAASEELTVSRAAESPVSEALALLEDPEATDVAVAAVGSRLLEALTLGEGADRPPMADFLEGSHGAADRWRSGLDGSEVECPFKARLLYAETWWTEWPLGPDGEPLIDGTRPIFKTRHKALAHARFGESKAWEYRSQLLLLLPQGWDVPHIFQVGSGSAGHVARMLKAAQHKRFRGHESIPDGTACPPYAQVWTIGTEEAVSKRKAGAKFRRLTFTFEGVNTQRPQVVEAARIAFAAADLGLDTEEVGDGQGAAAGGGVGGAGAAGGGGGGSGAGPDDDLPF